MRLVSDSRRRRAYIQRLPERSDMTFEERVAAKRVQLIAHIIDTLHVTSAMAEDIAHEALATAIAKQSQFQGGDSEGQLVSWLRVIAYRIGLKAVDPMLNAGGDGLSNLGDSATSPSKILRDDDSRARVREAIAELPDRQREVIMWHFFLNWSIKQVAEKLELNEGAVYGLKARALKRLSELLPPEQFHTFLG